MNLRHVDSQTLWSVASAAPVTWPTGNGTHVVFASDNTLISDGTNLVPGTHLLTVTNDEGKAAVCYLEMALQVVTGQTGTADNSLRAAFFAEPYHGVSKYAGDAFVDVHQVTRATQTLVSLTPQMSDVAGGTSADDNTGFPNQLYGTLQGGGLNLAPAGFIIGNRAVATGERIHLLTPIGVLTGADSPAIAGLQKLYCYIKSVNAAAVPANFQIAGKIVAHLYEWRS